MKLRYCLALPAAVALLSACGEGSNTLANPVANEAQTTTTCKDTKVCITGQFVDDPVVGLNYSCDLVEGVTDQDGVFVCPNNTIATFFLRSETGKRQIVIGKYRVRTIGSVSQGTIVKVNLLVTPSDLLTQVDTQNAGTRVELTNVLRLLQALDSDGHSTNKAINRIVIDSQTKKAIDSLTKDIAPSDFADTTVFNQLLQPMFDQLPNRSLNAITSAQALSRYESTLPVIHAGVYEAWPTVGLDINSNGQYSYSGMLGRWTGSDLHSMVSMLLVVDRDGKTIGNGLEWQKTLTPEQLNTDLITNNLLFKTTPTFVDFNSVEMGFENNGAVKSNFILNAEAGGTIKITQGTLFKGNIAGGDRFYRNIYGLSNSDTVDATKLGVWQRSSDSNITQLTGTLNLQKTRVVNAFLDPSVWRVNENVAIGEKPIFPLHLKMTLRDGDRSIACGGTTGNGCLVGDMGITILENGNIITDRDNDCSGVDAVTLQDQGDNTNNMQVAEQRLGLITTVLRDANQQAIKTVVPVMLVGSWARKLPATDPWKKFYGTYIGTAAGIPSVSVGTKVEIDISKVLDNVVTMTQQEGDRITFGLTPRWTNYDKLLRSYSMSAEDKAKINSQTVGLITSVQTQACYNPQPKQ